MQGDPQLISPCVFEFSLGGYFFSVGLCNGNLTHWRNTVTKNLCFSLWGQFAKFLESKSESFAEGLKNRKLFKWIKGKTSRV